MTRLIKRYGSRKLYDTQDRRYVSLGDLAERIRQGEDIRVVDNATEEDLSVLILTQIISDEGRRKNRFLSTDLLHDLIRTGEAAVTHGVQRVKQIQNGVDRFVRKSLDRVAPVRKMRREMTQLRERLDELERTLAQAEQEASSESDSKLDTGLDQEKGDQ